MAILVVWANLRKRKNSALRFVHRLSGVRGEPHHTWSGPEHIHRSVPQAEMGRLTEGRTGTKVRVGTL